MNISSKKYSSLEVFSIEPLPFFTSQLKFLPNIIQPFHNELLSSWLTRLLLENYSSYTTFCWNLGYRPDDIDIDLNLDNALILNLKEITGFSVKYFRNLSLLDIKNLFYDTLQKSIFNNSKIKDILFTDHRIKGRGGIRYCPLCLKEDNIQYFRKNWRFGFLPICFKHKCFLLTNCPYCKSKILYNRLKNETTLNYCYKCGKNLTKVKVEYIQNSDIFYNSFENQINNKKNLSKFPEFLSYAWIFAKYFNIYDKFFQNHPFINNKKIQTLFFNYKKKSIITPIFRDLHSLYLILGALFYSIRDLNEYLNILHINPKKLGEKKKFFCNHMNCRYTSSSFGRILVHTKHVNPLYGCSICYKTISSQKELKNHSQTHLKGNFYCITCKKAFNSQSLLRNHTKFHNISILYICKECGRVFGTKNEFTIHNRSHNSDINFKCMICNKKYKSKYSLEIHERVHSGARPYSCDYCDKSFMQKTHLNSHIRIHTGEKKYLCKICGKNLNQKYSLTLHIRTHTGEKPYSCNYCDRKFISKKELNRHHRIHTGQKPFRCEECNKAFRTIPSLIRHKKSHIVERPFICELCNKSYKRKNHLKRHLKIKHSFPFKTSRSPNKEKVLDENNKNMNDDRGL